MLTTTEERELSERELLDALAEKIEALRERGYDMRKARDYLQALRQEIADPIWQAATNLKLEV